VPETGLVYQFSNQIVQYDPQRNVATVLSFGGPAPRYNYAAAAYTAAAGKAYLFGGCDQGEWQSCVPRRDIFEFDPQARTNTFLAAQFPYGLNSAAAAYAPGTNKVYIFGGQTPDRASADIFAFDVATRNLQIIATKLPSGRRDAAAVFVPQTNRIYIFGGRTATVTLDEILAFDPATQSLSTLPTRLPFGLQKMAAAHVPSAGKVFLFGGEKAGGGSSKAVLEFNVTTDAIAQSSYLLPGDGLTEAAAVYVPGLDWLVLLGGRLFGTWPKNYFGILRLRYSGDTFVQYNSVLPYETHTASSVYVPAQNSAYVFGGEHAQIIKFEMDTGLVATMSATLPVTSTDPGTVWVPSQRRAYLFDRSTIYAYDPAGDVLAALPTTLPAGFDPRVAVYVPSRNAIYLFNSASGGSILRYNLANGTLVTLNARLPSVRRAAYGAYVPALNLIFLLGGWGYQDGGYRDEIWIFDVASETVSQQQQLRMPKPGEYKASAYLPTTNKINLLGGWGGWSEDYSFPFAEVWQFDATTGARRFITTTLTLPEYIGRQAVVWASREDSLYTFGGQGKTGPLTRYDTDRIYRFEFGHATQAVAQSTRVNSSSERVLRATLNVTQDLNGGTVNYFLSNNGGATWAAATPGVELTFTTFGSDLRWRATLMGDGVRTPTIDRLTIDWTTEGVTPTRIMTPTQTFTPTATIIPTPTQTQTYTATPTATLISTPTPSTTPSTRTPTSTVTCTVIPTSTRFVYLPCIAKRYSRSPTLTLVPSVEMLQRRLAPVSSSTLRRDALHRLCAGAAAPPGAAFLLPCAVLPRASRR
jgi:hypothetical protein